MCGFAGVIAWEERYRVSRETMAKMSAAIAHRGPDGEGMYFSPDASITAGTPQIALAHRRLAIIDPDPRANQPFTDGQGRYLVYNGEIYNYRELKRELKQLKPDYEWRTDCDTEVLLIAYDVWGEKCVKHFNGMFAFAIWDGAKQELFLARDRMGQKPLYYAQLPDDGGVLFASEMGAITSMPVLVDDALNEIALYQYLCWGYVPAPSTIRAAVGKFPAATVASVRYADVRVSSYFDSNVATATPSPIGRSVPSETRRHILDAVSRQLISDVPLGCFLSGGVDSSIIASAAKGASGTLDTFSIGFGHSRYDESAFAAAVAKHIGSKHHCFSVTADAFSDLPSLARVFGEPFADSSMLPTHYLARETRRSVKVALSGDGGDELFGGYDRYRAMRWGEKLKHLPHFVHRWAAIPYQLGLISVAEPKSLGARFTRFHNSLRMGPARRYSSYMRFFSHREIHLLLRGGISKRQNRLAESPQIGTYRKLARTRDVVQAALATDRITYLPGDVLTKVDRASMLHALEVRSPFMDHELVQFAAGLTTDQLLKGGPKRMLREAFGDDLPAWVFKRKKMGFAVPIGEWFRGQLRPMLHDHLFANDSFASSHFNMLVVRRLVEEHESGREDHSQRLYALLMLELWWNLR